MPRWLVYPHAEIGTPVSTHFITSSGSEPFNVCKKGTTSPSPPKPRMLLSIGRDRRQPQLRRLMTGMSQHDVQPEPPRPPVCNPL